ncbi:putative O-methyltransferase [Polyplosphaeria fusca]|uniref:O-methyltransferase n=1 Tax=Polyplosphaeria fusca TaxID=682080 RepID=A0A9P4QWN1_9PLEO|nr:putative O-methyltransferase [Polyplosphaeria fusca]
MSSLRELARTISTLADQLDDYNDGISANGAVSPETKDWLQNAPKELSQSRVELIDTLLELKYRLQSPQAALEDLFFGYIDTSSLQVIYALNLPSYVPVDQPISYAAIAAASGFSEHVLRRLYRYAMTNRIFTEPEPGMVAHTPISRMLLHPDAFDCLGMTMQELQPALNHLLDALKTNPESTEPNQTAYNIANNTDLPMYPFLGKHPDRAKRFGAGMRHFTVGDHTDLRHLIDAFPWKTYDREDVRMVDVGGGQGAVTLRIASETSKMKFTVQDLEQTAAVGRSQLPDNLKERVQFMGHDFFSDQPSKDVDIYFFRWIMHNWSDKYSVKIIQALIPGLKAGAKVLVYEHLREGDSVMKWSGKGAGYLDMVMLGCYNGSVRTSEEWKALFAQADSRFVWNGVTKVPGSALSLVEVTWEP